MMWARLGLALAVVALYPQTASPQISLSGSLDIAHKIELGKKRREPKSEINTSIKGQSPFSLVRARIFADAEVAEGVEVFTTFLFDEGLSHFEMEGAYVVINEVRDSAKLNVLVGKMPTAFGSFATRSFAEINPLIGVPALYQYFSAVRGWDVPADNADQLARRDIANYRSRGLPTIYDACWNTGVQVFGSLSHFSYALALTKGALSNPDAQDNDGGQLVGRLGWQPRMELRLGFSGAYGPYLEKGAEHRAHFPAGRTVEDYNQRIVGFDVEFTAGHFEFYSEWVRNYWELPNLEEEGLGSTGGYVETKYALGPGIFTALRYGRIDYDSIDDGNGNEVPWDYDIQRLETGLGYYLNRNLRLKATLQLNFRQGPKGKKTAHLLGGQLASNF